MDDPSARLAGDLLVWQMHTPVVKHQEEWDSSINTIKHLNLADAIKSQLCPHNRTCVTSIKFSFS